MTAHIVTLTPPPPKPPMVHIPDETEHVAHAAVRILPAWSLVFVTVLLALGMVGVGALDIMAIFNLLFERSLDAGGNSTITTLWLAVSAAIMLVGCFFLNCLFHSTSRMARIAAGMVYFAILAFLMLHVFKVYTPEVRQLWGTTVTMGSGNLGSHAAAAVSEPPLWLSVLVGFVVALVFSLPGLLFALLKNVAIKLHAQWLMRGEALAILKQVSELEAVMARARTARVAADHAKLPATIEMAAMAKVRADIDGYCTYLQATADKNIVHMNDPKPLQRRKTSLATTALARLKEAQSLTI